MHLAYVDDSGDSKHGVTLTALIVEDRHWSSLLDAWLAGRRRLHSEFGVPKNREIHAVEFYKGRARVCETREQDASFTKVERGIAARLLLSSLATLEPFTVLSIATPDVRKPAAYARFIAKLEDWAAENDTYLMVFYDGQQGLAHPDTEPTPAELSELWTTAVRNAAPYRRVHRDLELSTRRIVQDVMMQDSQYSQLIQAADLIAYGAYQRHRQGHPELWGGDNAWRAAIQAYMRLAQHWPDDSDNGVYWLV
ncbi:hypothetical protein GCM10023221_16170 [Luteimicrobium xylanilyticum]|uniref:DUF3800 domain-containing protein n=1 Tax=Luteimicrobium xylanilyticum TaxID=1133546 RepID=A0A5P9QHS4_9MICO|nr:DUF3800 domain-containing protein [Luteimicrobium xylanilyticum]QFV00016.1 hypothetical protein KDY119_03551 [Luteimicrobium xylanilyticum]